MFEIQYLEIKEDKQYEEIIEQVITKCYETEKLNNSNLYVSIILTENETIRKINQEYRNIDKATDVLSFPMFEKDEIKESKVKEPLGDIVISIPKIEVQAQEFGHGIKRELAYMVVHGFYHLMGYDHIEKQDKKIMREKEEEILKEIVQ